MSREEVVRQIAKDAEQKSSGINLFDNLNLLCRNASLGDFGVEREAAPFTIDMLLNMLGAAKDSMHSCEWTELDAAIEYIRDGGLPCRFLLPTEEQYKETLAKELAAKEEAIRQIDLKEYKRIQEKYQL